MEEVTDFIFLGSKITADSDTNHKIKTLSPWKESYDQSRQCIKKQRQNLWFFQQSCMDMTDRKEV